MGREVLHVVKSRLRPVHGLRLYLIRELAQVVMPPPEKPPEL